MIPLYEKWPSRVFVEGKNRRLRTDFASVLHALDVLKNEEFSAQERAAAANTLLYHRPPKNAAEGVERALAVLVPQQKGGSDVRTMDLLQDSGLIYAAFWQSYGIDLKRERKRLHFCAFLALLDGLPDGTRLSDIVQIRTAEIPAPNKNNAQSRAKLLQMKTRYALKQTEKERREQLEAGLAKIAQAMLAMAAQKK